MTRTQVAIIGAGPAGLFLAHLLDRAGIDCVILESRSREYVQSRVRAGVLEQGTVNPLRDLGLSTRMDQLGIEHSGVRFRFGGEDHRIDFPLLTGGKKITVYGQQKVVRDLIDAWEGDVLFDTPVVGVDGLTGATPVVRWRSADGVEVSLERDFVAGCDGCHGVSRAAIPSGVLRTFERTYPFSWLGVLAEVQPFSDELIYARNDDGLALHSLRSGRLSRNYVQVPFDARVEDWSDEEPLSTRRPTTVALSEFSHSDLPSMQP